MNKATSNGCFIVFRLFLTIFSFLFLSPYHVLSEEVLVYDEIAINVNVQHIGQLEVPSIIYREDVYLSVTTLFDFLKIKNTLADDLNAVNGFFIDQKAIFEINKENNRIDYQGKTYDLKPTDLVRTETDLYLKSHYFNLVFGLNCDFNFRTLSVNLTTKIELPLIREVKLEKMRKNLNKLKGNKIADSVIKQDFSVLQLGVADWSVTTTQDLSRQNNTRAILALGAIVAGGEATVNLNYDSDRPFSQKNQSYRWHYVNNDNPVIRQITAGRIYAPATSTLYGPVDGVQFTNTPTTYRKSFGTYRINNTTEPGWTVELYVNNVMVDFVKADASGFYSFEVPLVYGNSAIRTRVYGPFGEERTLEQNINIPFNLLPEKEFEYNVSSGAVNDGAKTFFTRADFNYGLNNRITIGAGAEYLSSANDGNPMPFIKSSIRLHSNLLFAGEYTYGVQAKGILNYRLPGDIQLDMNYVRYAKKQKAIMFNYIEERKIALSIPLRGKGFSAYSRFTFNQLILPTTKMTNAEFLLSAVISGISTNFTTSAVFSGFADPYITSDLSLTYQLPFALRVTPRVQYLYQQKSLSTLKLELEKNMNRIGFLNFSYENNLLYNMNSFTLGVRLNFSFIQTSFAVTQRNRQTSMVQSGRGSLLYNDQTNNLVLSHENHTGKGGLTISPFLDLNGNGRRDANEPKAYGLKLKSNGGRVFENKADTTINIRSLEAYTDYTAELSDIGFDNISWQLKKKSIQVTISPNHYRLIEIPVSIVGEVSGTVYLGDAALKAGLANIKIDIYNRKSVLVATTVTEEDGYFTYMGLAPGEYKARVNLKQLQKLQLKPIADLPFTIAMSKDGEMIDGLDFNLKKG